MVEDLDIARLKFPGIVSASRLRATIHLTPWVCNASASFERRLARLGSTGCPLAAKLRHVPTTRLKKLDP
jgi:hypothetical protein